MSNVSDPGRPNFSVTLVWTGLGRGSAYLIQPSMSISGTLRNYILVYILELLDNVLPVSLGDGFEMF